MLDLPADTPIEDFKARLAELHEAYRTDYQGYYDRHATADSPAIRGADPAIVLVPGVGMFCYGKDKQTARVAGEFYLNAINVMRGAEAISTYAPDRRVGEVRASSTGRWKRPSCRGCPSPNRWPPASPLVTGAGFGIGKAIATRLAAEGACVVIADLDADKAAAAAEEIGNSDVAIGVAADVTDEDAVQAAVRRDGAGVRRHRHRRQQRRPVAVEALAGHHRRGLGPAAQRDGHAARSWFPRPPPGR